MDTNKKIETNFSSIDDIDKKIHANQTLYDELHQSLVDEVVANAENSQEESHKIKRSSSSQNTFFTKLTDYYQSSELFRYALWGLAAVFFCDYNINNN